MVAASRCKVDVDGAGESAALGGPRSVATPLEKVRQMVADAELEPGGFILSSKLNFRAVAALPALVRIADAAQALLACPLYGYDDYTDARIKELEAALAVVNGD